MDEPLATNDFHEHVLRSWTVAEQYQRVLREWASSCWRVPDDPDGKVTEIKITYRDNPCRECAATDPEIDISVSWVEPQGQSTAVTRFDSAETVRSLAEALTRLVPIAEEHGR